MTCGVAIVHKTLSLPLGNLYVTNGSIVTFQVGHENGDVTVAGNLTVNSNLFLSQSGTQSLSINADTGTITTSGSIYVAGLVTAEHPVSIQFYGTPTLYNSSQSSLSSTTSTGNWFFPLWSSNSNQNLSPSYSNTVQLQVFATGLYAISFTLATTQTSSGEIAINSGTGLGGNFFDSNMLAAQGWNTAYAGFDCSCSCFAQLSSGALITFAIYFASGTLQLGGRSRAQVVLMQKTA